VSQSSACAGLEARPITAAITSNIQRDTCIHFSEQAPTAPKQRGSPPGKSRKPLA